MEVFSSAQMICRLGERLTAPDPGVQIESAGGFGGEFGVMDGDQDQCYQGLRASALSRRRIVEAETTIWQRGG